MTMYMFGALLAFIIGLMGLYKERERLFSKYSDLTLASTVIFITVSSWLYVGFYLFTLLNRFTAEAKEETAKTEDKGEGD